MRREDQFKRGGMVWFRQWTADGYIWSADSGLSIGWNPVEAVDAGHDDDGEIITKHRRTYYAESNGRRHGSFDRATVAMDEAIRSNVRAAA